MTIYWLLLLLPATAAFMTSGNIKQVSKPKNYLSANLDGESLVFGLFAFLLFLLLGFRHHVGGDWEHYLKHIDGALEQTWIEGLVAGRDPAYGLMTWISAQLGGGIYLVNLVCAAVFVSGLMVFALNSPQPWLTICVAMPYLVIVVAMGYTRQGVAIGLIMIGLVALDKGYLYRFATWLFLAALFHKSALILLPMAVFAGRKKWATVLGIFFLGALMFTLLLAEYVDNLVEGYITDQYASSGAAIRVAMNAFPATIFLLMRNRFGLTLEQKSFWVWMSLIALGFIALLVASPSSTAVDRVALYWIPLQLFVWSRLPQAMGKHLVTQRQWLLLVLAYSFAVQFIWLFYSDHSYAWLPYRFYPWEWLWF